MKARSFIRRAVTVAVAVCAVASALIAGLVAAPAQANTSSIPAPDFNAADASVVRPVIVSVPKGKLDALVSFASTLRLTTEYQYTYALTGIAMSATVGQLALIQQTFPDATISDQVTYTTADTQTNAPWDLSMLDQQTLPADSTFSYPATAGEGVKVYVIDTGVSPNATQFGTRLETGYDFTGSGSTADCVGHGTHVAGTIGSRDYGVAKKAIIVPLRALGGMSGGTCSGSGSNANVLAAINKAIALNPAGTRAVINMSLGSTSPDGQDMQMNAAVTAARADGIVVVVAAGNSADSPWIEYDSFGRQIGGDNQIHGQACDYSPANSPGTITVGAVNGVGSEASFSNYGQCVDIFAPGVNIRSLSNTNPASSVVMSGTSMASPHVAGAVALYIAEHPTETVPNIVTNVLAGGRTGAVTMWPGGLVSGRQTPAHTNNPSLLLNISSLLDPPTNATLPVINISSNAGANGKPRFVPGGVSTTLTATEGTWNGGTGTTSFAWYRCANPVTATTGAPTGCQAISGATSQTYTLTRDDVDYSVTSSVTYTNGQGVVTATAASAGPVGETPSNSIAPSITAADTNAGTVISVNDGTWRGSPSNSYTHQWLVCTSAVPNSSATTPAGCSEIAGATGNTYTLLSSQAGKFIAVETRARNAASGTATTSFFSASTNAVRTAPIYRSTQSTVAVSGVRLGLNLAPQYVAATLNTSVLTAAPGDWLAFPVPTISYLWYRCINPVTASSTLPADCVSTGVTTSTYTITADDVGSYVAASVTAANELGSTTRWQASPTAVGIIPTASRRPALTTISPRVGRAISFAPGAWSGTPTPTRAFQWYTCAAPVRTTVSSLPRGCSRVTGTQRSSIVPTRAMVGRYLLIAEVAKNPLTAGVVTYSKTTGVVRY